MLARVLKYLCCTCSWAVNYTLDCYCKYKGNGVSGKLEQSKFKDLHYSYTFCQEFREEVIFLIPKASFYSKIC